MGHNKGWEEAASMFSGDSVVLKTCNAALLEAEGKSWVEVSIIPVTKSWFLYFLVFVHFYFVSDAIPSFGLLVNCQLNLTAGYILRAVIEPPLKCSSVVLASCNSGPKRQFRNPTITYNIWCTAWFRGNQCMTNSNPQD